MKLPVRQLKQYNNLVIEDADGKILNADQIVAALNTPPQYVQSEDSKRMDWLEQNHQDLARHVIDAMMADDKPASISGTR